MYTGISNGCICCQTYPNTNNVFTPRTKTNFSQITLFFSFTPGLEGYFSLVCSCSCFCISEFFFPLLSQLLLLFHLFLRLIQLLEGAEGWKVTFILGSSNSNNNLVLKNYCCLFNPESVYKL